MTDFLTHFGNCNSFILHPSNMFGAVPKYSRSFYVHPPCMSYIYFFFSAKKNMFTDEVMYSNFIHQNQNQNHYSVYLGGIENAEKYHDALKINAVSCLRARA